MTSRASWRGNLMDRKETIWKRRDLDFAPNKYILPARRSILAEDTLFLDFAGVSFSPNKGTLATVDFLGKSHCSISFSRCFMDLFRLIIDPVSPLELNFLDRWENRWGTGEVGIAGGASAGFWRAWICSTIHEVCGCWSDAIYPC